MKSKPTGSSSYDNPLGKKILHLTLKKKWFDMIASGEKKAEYREVKMYWASRLLSGFSKRHLSLSIHHLKCSYRTNSGETVLDAIKKDFDFVLFKNGYSKNSPYVLVEYLGVSIDIGYVNWGAENGKEYFVIKLGKIFKQ